MKRNIIFVINYFYPDYASTGQLLTELCLHIQHDFNITVVAAQPGYAGEKGGDNRKRIVHDRLENIEIIRIRLPKLDKQNKVKRLAYIATYFLFANWVVLKQRKPDFIYTISQPPILGGLIGSIGKLFKRAKHIYNIQDFNPEQAEAVGYTKNKFIYNFARWVDTRNCKWADHIITVGYDMQETLLKRFGEKPVTGNTVINNWTNEQEIVPLSRQHPKVAEFIRQNGWTDKFIIMYSGNLGLYYDLENLIRVAGAFKERTGVVFAFIGEGAVKQQMIEYVKEHNLTNVDFLPYQPIENLKYSLNAADVHLVVNQKGIKGVSVPSKIYGVMAAGKAIMGVLESGSEAHRLIVESESGVVAEPQDYDDVIRQLNYLVDLRPGQLAEYGARGRAYLEANLSRDLSLEKYRKLLLSM